ncbi:MAG TPA: hypothetical protein VM261_03640 [Kofleriaceae bacterium]|nr:hypothetical protein [Kofleriaceae bacterium]
MGLFDKKDKKRKDDFDSPVDQVDLGASSRPAASEPPKAAAPAPAPEPVRSPPAASAAASPSPAPAASTTAAPAAAAPKPAAAPAAAPAPARAQGGAASMDNDDYGIDKAIELMRTLPSENIELVVQVVKFSLESVGIHLPTIIQDAVRRQNDLQGRIAALKAEIADLEAEIKQRRDEIAKHEGDHKETSLVRDRLELAEKIGKGAKPAAAAGSSSSTSSSSSSGSSDSSAPSSSTGSLPTLGGTPHRSHPATGQTAVIPPKK